MHKSATKCNETIGKWCKNKHGASKIIDTFETYQAAKTSGRRGRRRVGGSRKERRYGSGRARAAAEPTSRAAAAEPFTTDIREI
jgi:hypothetical protein